MTLRKSSLYGLGLLAGLALPARCQEVPLSDDGLRVLWDELSAPLQTEAVEYLRFECRYLQSFQLGLIRYLLQAQEVDPGTWPQATEAEWFEPETHAPAQPIRREWLSERSSKLRRERERLLRPADPNDLRLAYRYDWGTRELRRLADPEEPALVFENALLGFPPDTDLAEALLLARLDDGAQQAALAAFGHAYTDRTGKAYAGITLYDAWSSGQTIEMPDVDALGIVHTLMDEWERWRAPVPPSQQEPLYSAIAEHFVPARRHRSLREALARVYMRGSGTPSDEWTESTDRLHALWELHESTPQRLAAGLPEPDDFEGFLEDWAERCLAEPALLRSGELRRATLDNDRLRLRQTWERIVRELSQRAPASDEDQDLE